MYVIPYEPGEWKDYNSHELHELKKRKALEEWIKEDDLLKKLIMEDEELDERFMNLLLLIADVKEKELAGTHEEESLGDILSYQRSLIKIMRDLQEKFANLNKTWDQELQNNRNEIRSLNPKLEDMKMLRGDRFINMEDIKLGQEDGLITKLKEALTNENITPEDLTNLLFADIQEKKKLTQQLQHMKKNAKKGLGGKQSMMTGGQQQVRFTERQIAIIHHQFQFPKKKRNLKVMDAMMKHLRYLKRHDLRFRL